MVTLTNPYVYKYFGNTSVWLGQESRVTIRIYNRDTNYALHQVSVTDSLPAGLVVAATGSPYTSNCGLDVSLIGEPGGTSFTVEDAEIPANSSCYVIIMLKGQRRTTLITSSDCTDNYEGVTNPNSTQDDLTINGCGSRSTSQPIRSWQVRILP